MLEAYRKHVEERAAQGVVPQPLNAEQTAGLVELLKNPPAGEEEFLLDLITNRVPPGVDEAAYVKAGFLSAIVKGEATSPLSTSNVPPSCWAPCRAATTSPPWSNCWTTPNWPTPPPNS